MAEDDLRKGSNLKKFIENLIGIKESDVNPNIAPSMFGDEIEKKFSTQSTLTDVEPVGKLREKTTGAKFSKTGKTFYGVANTKDAIKIAAQYGYGKGDFIPADVINKYPDLAEAAKDVVDTGIGDDDVLLNPELRTKAAECFRALSWAFYEGSK